MNQQHQMLPNYSFMFQFERKFDHQHTKEWMERYWHTSFYAVAIYMVVIFGGQAYMSNRPAFKLRRILTIWNTSLALFSILGTFRTLPELLHVLFNHGFYHSVCTSSFIEDVKPSGFWTWMFALSKVPELGDTVFIVLRKQNLIFLHWYHHITVLLFTWFTYSEYTAPARWFVDMNYLVHSLMYSYYALKALGLRLPRKTAMLITTSQIVQMIIGAYVTWYAYYRKSQGDACRITKESANLGLLMYSSYFVLFAQFFYNAYFGARRKAPTTPTSRTSAIKQD
ncbi:Elongation of very long chain fatty acids protein 6, partial [Fragariocoptes setiger]